MSQKHITIDGNEAAASVAYKLSEVIAIYPITPSSNMGEWADEWASQGRPNLWGTVPLVQEMQSEGGAAGAVHGALQAGSLACTFTASQGLLLMIPNMYKIAGELTPTVFHIAARSLAAHALSIFGDHQDVMSARATGWAFLASSSVQETMDMALIAHAATLKARVPFVHFFDGFRTSHEVSKIEPLADEVLAQMVDGEFIAQHRFRAMSPDRPVLRGTAQNPDVYFQAREAVNKYYEACPALVQGTMDAFAKLTGRAYKLFDYCGAPDADRVVVLMGSGCEAAQETVEALIKKGEKVGLLKVRLYRPFSLKHMVDALPKTVKTLSVLDRTKEPGASGDPLYLDVMNAVVESNLGVKVLGGRYGLSSKEFTPAMVKAVFDNAAKAGAKNHFTVGINDDVTHTSLPVDSAYHTEADDVVRAMFYGLGADGTVSANKSSIKIIGEYTPNYAQGYFVYDSKKSGAMTVSHLRFGPRPIRSTYLIDHAQFVACHQFNFMEKYDTLTKLTSGGVFLLNSPFGADQVWNHLPRKAQEMIIQKKAKFFVIDAVKVAKDTGMGGRINTIMQTCFFAISGVLPKDKAIELIKKSIEKTYGKKGEEIVKMNFLAVDQTLANLFEVKYPAQATSTIDMCPPVTMNAPAFVKDVLGQIIDGRGDSLPVSAFPVDGTFPLATAQYEKRNISLEIPAWDPGTCIQCNKCVMVCPHAVIRAKVYDPKNLSGAPATFKSAPSKNRDWAGQNYTIQVAPEDCTGCALCVDICPAKNKSDAKLKAINMAAQPPLREEEKKNWEFFLGLPEMDRRQIKVGEIRASQLMQPLFEFSGACAGCGETPYIKLMTQLFGDRALVANATGCSSIYSGNLPTTPYAVNAQGRGPAWSNSLFEDNAEFGLGFRLSVDKNQQMAQELLKKLEGSVGGELAKGLLEAQQTDETGIFDQRERVAALKEKLKGLPSPEARALAMLADSLVKKSVWIFGGDGWAYDIGYGGLDHVLAAGRDVNILVMDTEVYSNTGGQASKATPRAAVAKFAMGGKALPKKDLARMAMTYGHVYVASVAMGARDEHTLRAFLEAEAYPGPSLIIAYSHCIAHGINMTTGMRDHKEAVSAGHWLLFRYNPLLALQGKNPLQMDSQKPTTPLKDFLYKQNRFKMLTKSQPEDAARLLTAAEKEGADRWALYERLALPHGSLPTSTGRGTAPLNTGGGAEDGGRPSGTTTPTAATVSTTGEGK